MEKKNILDTSFDELNSFLTENGEKKFRTKQITDWIWRKGERDFNNMKNISTQTRKLLDDNFQFNKIEISNEQKSADGTYKVLWNLTDGVKMESVLIPSRENKFTLCVSSQAGCNLGCKFCATGDLGLSRNLKIGEIYDQILWGKQKSNDLGANLSNIVFMGMGEPFMNYNNVINAIKNATNPEYLGISPYRITISTCGIPSGIIRLADEESKINLAISLHSAKEGVRSKIMPINNSFNLKTLAEAIIYFVEKTGVRPTFEYLIMKDINDSLEEARALADYCKQFPIKINIIEYNEVKGSEFHTASDKNTEAFVKFLESKNMVVNIRRSKGKDIDAACGQLAAKKSQSL